MYQFMFVGYALRGTIAGNAQLTEVKRRVVLTVCAHRLFLFLVRDDGFTHCVRENLC